MKLYEGIEAKTLQALMGSFIYFYAYAFLKVNVGGGWDLLRSTRMVFPCQGCVSSMVLVFGNCLVCDIYVRT